MASTALEKSLDEIIGDRPSNPRRGSEGRRPRGPRGPRAGPYARAPRDTRPYSERDDRRRDDRDVEGDRWSHDRYRSSDRSQRRERDDRGRDGGPREGRATRLRVANIHYDLSESEVRDLFERIAPVARFSMCFDRAGRSEGLAFVTYDRYSDAKLAMTKYDGQAALGQLLEVELDSVVPPPRTSDRDLASRISGGHERQDGRGGAGPERRQEPRSAGRGSGRGRARGEKVANAPSSARRGPVTLDELDNELDNYINQRNKGDSQKVAESGAEGGNAEDGMQID